MSIKATQPEDISVIEQTVQLMRMVDAYAYDYAYTGKLASTRVELERKLRAALATPSPQPATTKEVGGEAFTETEIAENPRLKFEPENWVRRDDGKVVRVDRWEWGVRAIVSILFGNRHEFEISEVVERVEALAAAAQPAEAKTAAVDVMTNGQIDAALEAWFANGPVGVEHKTDRTRMRSAIAAAIATQEGGHD